MHRRRTGCQCQCQLGAVVHVGQAQHLRHIQLHGILGNSQLTGDLVVGLALAHQAGYFQLAWRQLLERRWQFAFTLVHIAGTPVHALAPGFLQVLVKLVHRLCQVLQTLAQPAQLAEAALALLHGLFLAAYALQQFIEVHGFLVVIGKALAQRSDHILLLRSTGHHDGLERALPALYLQFADQFNTITTRHVQVTDDHANGLVCQVTFQGFVSGVGRQAAVTLGFEKLTQLFDYHWLVIDHQYLHITECSGHDQLPVVTRSCSRAKRSAN